MTTTGASRRSCHSLAEAAGLPGAPRGSPSSPRRSVEWVPGPCRQPRAGRGRGHGAGRGTPRRARQAIPGPSVTPRRDASVGSVYRPPDHARSPHEATVRRARPGRKRASSGPHRRRRPRRRETRARGARRRAPGRGAARRAAGPRPRGAGQPCAPAHAAIVRPDPWRPTSWGQTRTGPEWADRRSGVSWRRPRHRSLRHSAAGRRPRPKQATPSDRMYVPRGPRSGSIPQPAPVPIPVDRRGRRLSRRHNAPTWKYASAGSRSRSDRQGTPGDASRRPAHRRFDGIAAARRFRDRRWY